jgi:hypothetical protein
MCACARMRAGVLLCLFFGLYVGVHTTYSRYVALLLEVSPLSCARPLHFTSEVVQDITMSTTNCLGSTGKAWRRCTHLPTAVCKTKTTAAREVSKMSFRIILSAPTAEPLAYLLPGKCRNRSISIGGHRDPVLFAYLALNGPSVPTSLTTGRRSLSYSDCKFMSMAWSSSLLFSSASCCFLSASATPASR